MPGTCQTFCVPMSAIRNCCSARKPPSIRRTTSKTNRCSTTGKMCGPSGDKEQEFVSILPFTPANRNNLIGWIAGRSDGDKYGTLRAYRFPKTRFVDGPLQIQARIDQDPQLSSQLTLWNQQGSTVIRGNLLVIPLGNTLLFAEPIYLQAERSPMPELRLVVLATQDRLAYASRFPEALKNLLGGATAPPPAITTGATPTQPPTSSGKDPLNTLVEKANQS